MSVPSLSRRGLLAGSAAAAAGAAGATAAGPSARAGAPRGLADPFTLGVASGDPSAHGVVLWTRLAPRPLARDGLGGMPSRRYDAGWQLASDPLMTRVVRTGSAVAAPGSAHAVHVEVGGLRPGAEYFYRFRVGRHLSPVGRTCTAPAPGTFGPALSMAFASCSNYQAGFFTAYARMAEEHPTLVLHLGDYLYEAKRRGSGPREHAPAGELSTLADYRLRHAQYRTDADLQAAHAVAPWLVVWDDHELDNNYADEVPSPAGQPGFLARRAAAYRAYYEHLPLRRTSRPRGIDMQLFRRVPWGSLASFHLLDTRQYRSDQACGEGIADCPAAAAAGRSITGARQQAWLLDGLDRSTSTWDLLGQQVFFAARDYAIGNDVAYNMDTWDGYLASRDRILAGFARNRAANPVVLTGDVHKHFANHLMRDFDDPDSRVIGTELVCTSVTSGGDGGALDESTRLRLAENQHIRFASDQRGYVSLRIGRDRLRADFKVLPYVRRPGAPVQTAASYVVEAGRPGLHRV